MFNIHKRKNKRGIVLAFLLVFQMASLNFTPSAAAASTSSAELTLPYQAGTKHLVVETAPGTDLQALAAASGGKLVRTGPLAYCTLEYEQSDQGGILQQVLKYPGVLSAEWSKTYAVSQNSSASQEATEATGNASQQTSVADPEYSLQWGLKAIRADQVWNEGITGQGVTVAIIDTGVDLDQPDLVDYAKKMNNLVPGYNAITRSTAADAPQDDNGHGTSVAGVIAALSNNKGIVGVAYNAKVMPIKAMDKNGQGDDSVIADGIVWAADHGAKIINMSIGSQGESKILEDALSYAENKGCLLVAASGNNKNVESSTIPVPSGQNGVAFPAAYPGVIAVSAVDSSDRIADFALTGPEVLLAAPGEKVLTDYWSAKETGCAYVAGTSIASPFVSAAAALLWSRFPQLSSQEIQKALTGSAYDLGTPGRDDQYGFGRLDVYRALKTLEEQQTYSSPATLGWEGGKVYSGGTAADPVAILIVPAGTFPVEIDGSGLDKKITVSLKTVDSPGAFPQGITPAGEAINLNSWGENSPQKALSLEVELTAAPQSAQSQIAYLYKWSDTRWIRVGGGFPASAARMQVTIYEPGTYRAGWSAEPDADRISGKDRIGTAVEIAKQAFPTGADTVILARADAFPDALAGAPLAYKYQAPVLLTYPDSLPPEVYRLIQDLAPKRIYILGGPGAVSSSIESELSKLAGVSRIAGDNRYATAAAVAGMLGTKGQAVIVNGANFPDAIAAAAQAAVQGLPILLTPKDSLSTETQDALNKLAVASSEVVGGPGVISDDLFSKLMCPKRLNGADRYATSAGVVQAGVPEGRILYIATGVNFPDALTGGILAAANSSGILLIPKTGPTDMQVEVLQAVKGKKVIALGGEGAVPQDTLQKVQQLVK
jgi:minor extracellular protease Epr